MIKRAAVVKQGITPNYQLGTAGSSPASRSKIELVRATAQAAQAFYQRWHYIGTAPSGMHLGYYDETGLAGMVTLKGISARKGYLYRFDELSTQELSRLALRDDCPKNSESRLLAALFRWCRKNDIHLLLAYSDPGVGHLGIIYRATNWLYLGQDVNLTGNRHPGSRKRIIIDGHEVSPRSLYTKHGTSGLPALKAIYGKRLTTARRFSRHTYLMPLTRKMRKLVMQRFRGVLRSW